MKTAFALMHGIQNTKVTSKPVSMHMMAKAYVPGLRDRVERRAVSWSGMPLLKKNRASVVITDDNDDDADDGNFDDTLGEILGASSRVATSLDLDLAFGAVDSNLDSLAHHFSLHSPPSPLPSPLLLLLLLLGSPS